MFLPMPGTAISAASSAGRWEVALQGLCGWIPNAGFEISIMQQVLQPVGQLPGLSIWRTGFRDVEMLHQGMLSSRSTA